MTLRSAPPAGVLLFAGGAAALAFATARAGDRPATEISIRAGELGYGGEEYGSGASGGGYVTMRREIEVDADGRVRVAGIARDVDPSTVELRLDDSDTARVIEQRQIGNTFAPDALLTAQIGQAVTATTTAGVVTGTLRAVGSDALVIEAADHSIAVVPRGPQLQAVKLVGATGDFRPAFEWRLAGAAAGRHQAELRYQLERVAWSPSYVAVLSDGGAVELASWAVIDNRSGTDFTDANVTLTTGGSGVLAALGMAPARPGRSKLAAFTVPTKVTLRDGQTVQVELAPRKTVANPRTTVVFEALDPAAGLGSTNPSQCGDYVPENPRFGTFLELDVGVPLPDGKVRMLRRGDAGLRTIREDRLRASAALGMVRIPVEREPELSLFGARTELECRDSMDGRSVVAEIQLEIRNEGGKDSDVVVREYMYRWHTWKIVSETVKGVRVDDRTQEYRVRVPSHGEKTVKLVVRYEW